jgi:hypothetical protein
MAVAGVMIAHQVAGNGEEKGREIVDLLTGLEPRQAQERFLGQVGRHLRTTGAPGDERFQGFLLFSEQARDLRIPGGHSTTLIERVVQERAR